MWAGNRCRCFRSCCFRSSRRPPKPEGGGGGTGKRERKWKLLVVATTAIVHGQCSTFTLLPVPLAGCNDQQFPFPPPLPPRPPLLFRFQWQLLPKESLKNHRASLSGNICSTDWNHQRISGASSCCRDSSRGSKLFELIYSWECSPRRLPKESTLEANPTFPIHFLWLFQSAFTNCQSAERFLMITWLMARECVEWVH